MDMVVKEFGKCLWDLITPHFSYLFCYVRNVDTLEVKVTELKQRQDRVQHAVAEAKQRGQIIYPDVVQLLSSVDNMKSSVEDLVARSENTKCWNGCCWNPILCYGLGKEAAKNIMSVCDLIEKLEKLNGVSHLPSPPTTESLLPNRGFQDFETTKKMMKVVFDALKDDKINIIGVHGMGGVGKTTLMNKVAKQAEQDKLFNKVIVVTVSQTVVKENIQNVIAEMVGFKFEDDSVLREKSLLARLKQEEKLLVILDDVWEKLEFSDIGIPCGDADKGCKIVITSRSANVCNWMIGTHGSEIKGCLIEVKPLHEVESWNLFKMKAGTVVNSNENELSQIASNIVKECKGLPLAIVVLGLTLRNKSDPDVWKAVLEKLKNSIPEEIQGMQKEVFQSIKNSYDYLESEKTKLCFLFCCLFPEDEDIDLTNITRYMVGEGLIKFTETLDEARNQVSLLFDNLKNSGLLLEGDRERSVKMHDIVRDVAIWIASTKYGFCSRPKVALKEWPGDMESCQRISLQYNEISELPREPMSFPNLHTLLLNGNRNLKMIPKEFFSDMKALKVLDLSSTEISSLPSSLSFPNLHTLLLNGNWNLKMIPEEFFSDMKALKVLNLSSSEISSLPSSLSFPNLHTLLLNGNRNLEMIPEEFFPDMKALKVLDLSSTKISSLPSSLLSLMNLRVLLLHDCQQLRDLSGIGTLKRLEVLHLSRIEALESLEEPDFFHSPVVLPAELGELSNLRSLNLCDTWCRIPSGVISRLTRLEELNMDHSFEDWQPKGSQDKSHAAFAELACLSRLRSLSVRIRDETCFHQELRLGCFQELNRFQIVRSDYIFYSGSATTGWISDSHGCFHATTLAIVGSVVPHWAKLLAGRAKELLLYKCPGVEFLHGWLDISITVFSNIKHLRLFEMKDLCRLCQMAPPGRLCQMAPPDGFLANLKDLRVKGCHKLANIFSSDLISRAHQLEYLKVSHCNQLCHVFDYDCALGGESHDPILLPHLRTLHLQFLPQLTSIWEGGAPPQSLGNLRDLAIQGCHSLKHVFTWGQYPSLALLEDLSVGYCDQLCHVFHYDSALGGESHDPILLPHMRRLHLDHLPQLTSIWKGGAPPQSLGNLRHLSISGCHSLKHVFTWGQFPSLELLEELSVGYCKQLCHVLHYDSALGGESHNPILLPHLRTLHLEFLPQLTSIWEGGAPPQSLSKVSIEKCDSLKHVFTWGQFPSLTSLVNLSISGCDSLKHVFTWGQSRSLALLQSLTIQNCSGMEAIIMSDEANSEVQVTENNSNVLVLPRLTWLTLDRLGIASFDEGGDSLFDWPSLKNIEIRNCPNLKKLPLSSQGAPGLHRIHGSVECSRHLNRRTRTPWYRRKVFFPPIDLEDTQVSINSASTSASDID